MTDDDSDTIAKDMTGFQVTSAIEDWLKSDEAWLGTNQALTRPTVTAEILYIHIPEGTHPTPATATILATVDNFVLTIQMVFPRFGDDDRFMGEVSAICLQRRISGDRLTYPTTVTEYRESLDAAVDALLKRVFSSKLGSLDGLRRLQRRFAQADS
jgi:hypothetical protein